METPSDVAMIGDHLLRPVDQIAVAVIMDPHQTVTGVFPIAAHQLSGETIKRLVKLAISTDAHHVAIAAGKNGDAWQVLLEEFHGAAKRYLARYSAENEDFDPDSEEGVEFSLFDTVSVGEDGQYRSVKEHGSLRWGSR